MDAAEKRASILRAAMLLYELGGSTKEELHAKLGMSYGEAIRYWYAFQTAKAKFLVQYEKLAGRITAEQFKAIIEEGGGHGAEQ